MNIKNTFPTVEAFEKHLEKYFDDFYNQIKRDVGLSKKEYKKARIERRIFWILFCLTLLSFVSLINSGFQELISWQTAAIILSIVILSLLVAIKIGIGASKKIERFNKDLNLSMYRSIFALLDIDAKIFPNKPSYSGLSTNIFKNKDVRSVINMFYDSELITEKRNVIRSDDRIEGSFYGRDFMMAELFAQNNVTSSLSFSRSKMFVGYFVSLALKKELSDKIFISTDGDRSGFGQRDFLNRVKTLGARDVEFESNEFEEKLHVSSTDPVVAREILDPSFMSDLFDWWKSKRKNIRISFIKSEMNILFPHGDVKLGKTVSKLSKSEIMNYFKSIALPLYHIACLVEDVKY